jgi:hypothetical protein
LGWQDPAIIRKTGLCVWRSGKKPVLHFKRNGDFLHGHMALHYTDISHDTPGNADNDRAYDMIEAAGLLAKDAVHEASIFKLGEANSLSCQMQLKEGMRPLPEVEGCVCRKYAGGGWGGYALYLFKKSEDRNASVASAKCNRPYQAQLGHTFRNRR